MHNICSQHVFIFNLEKNNTSLIAFALLAPGLSNPKTTHFSTSFSFVCCTVFYRVICSCPFQPPLSLFFRPWTRFLCILSLFRHPFRPPLLALPVASKAHPSPLRHDRSSGLIHCLLPILLLLASPSSLWPPRGSSTFISSFQLVYFSSSLPSLSTLLLIRRSLISFFSLIFVLPLDKKYSITYTPVGKGCYGRQSHSPGWVMSSRHWNATYDDKAKSFLFFKNYQPTAYVVSATI